MTAAHAPARYVDPELLICPDCSAPDRAEPPAYWTVADGLPASQSSRLDDCALCRERDGAVVEPIESRTGRDVVQLAVGARDLPTRRRGRGWPQGTVDREEGQRR